jgi:undecaprenyl diphosphate synthase
MAANVPNSELGTRNSERTQPETADRSAIPVPSSEILPKHIAIIMDGNGRWAAKQNQPRSFGHAHGAHVARSIALECARLGVEVLTLYSFSTENWKRPQDEVDFLMALGEAHLKAEQQTIHERNIRFRPIGSRHGIPPRLMEQLDMMAEMTASNTGMTLCLALNYGSRVEITEAVQKIAEKAAAGTLSPADITQQTISDHLYTAGLPDPDLMIRTAGEMRISNFLLWQLSYAELYVTDTLWPEFTTEKLNEAIAEYARRQRRFGGV